MCLHSDLPQSLRCYRRSRQPAKLLVRMVRADHLLHRRGCWDHLAPDRFGHEPVRNRHHCQKIQQKIQIGHRDCRCLLKSRRRFRPRLTLHCRRQPAAAPALHRRHQHRPRCALCFHRPDRRRLGHHLPPPDWTSSNATDRPTRWGHHRQSRRRESWPRDTGAMAARAWQAAPPLARPVGGEIPQWPASPPPPTSRHEAEMKASNLRRSTDSQTPCPMIESPLGLRSRPSHRTAAPTAVDRAERRDPQSTLRFL